MCPGGYRLNLSLIDSGGTRIAKSSIGDGKCKLLSALTKSQMRQENYSQKHVLVLTKMMSFQYDKFDLLDCFKIQASGDYTLEVHANLYKLKYPDLESVTVPDILIKISILKADLDRYSSLKDNSQ
jgi:hypothetical protein